MKNKSEKIWEVVVIGGGPAGMMAAGRAAERGRSVLLLERNQKLGNKLMLTGGGRCNLTNYRPDIRVMLANYKESEKFLYSAFSQFGVEDTLEFFRNLGMETKEEENGRVFPVTDRAKTVIETLYKYMLAGGVEIRMGEGVEKIKLDKNNLFEILLDNGDKIKAQACVVATGGTSYQETGSTGDGLRWLKKIGHKVVDSGHSLVPIVLKDEWVKEISGVTLTDVELTSWQNGKKQKSYQGSLLFTHFGISGPMVLNMSREIGELSQKGEVVINLDLVPEIDQVEVKRIIQNLLTENNNRTIKSTLRDIMISALVEPLLELAQIDGEKYNHSVRSEERTRLVALIKAMPMHVENLLVTGKAIYSVGGVVLEEINLKTMQSRLVPNLYIVGDLLNIDRPSGGYSLQLCWTTGYVAGDHV